MTSHTLKARIAALTSLLMMTAFQPIRAQQVDLAPGKLVVLANGTLNERMTQAAAFAAKNKEQQFWLGYAFDKRPEVEAGFIYAADGNIMIGSRTGSWSSWHDGSMPGRTTFALETPSTKVTILFLIDKQRESPEEIRLFYNLHKVEIENRPGFWLQNVETHESLDYLNLLVFDPSLSDQAAAPLLLAVGLHPDPAAIAVLSEVAKRRGAAHVRESAVRALARIPSSESFASLVKLYDNKEGNPHLSTLQEELVFALSQQQSDSAVEKLSQIALEAESPETRDKAIFWLGQMAGEKSLSVLGGLIESEHLTAVKTQAVYALSQHENQREAANLLMNTALTNPNPEVRRTAIFWLAQIEDDRVVGFLKKLILQ